jgi:4a-hydroxytetrahydrobiopterin dehydratase
MKLNELFEAPSDEVAIIFGRFNPPHKGHRAAWEIASQSENWFVGTNQSTVGLKDPLPYEIKVEAMKTVYPEIEGHLMPETSWVTMASKIYEKFGDVKLLVLTDEDWVTKTLQQYNGIKGKPHGFYNFSSIEQKPTPRLSSATALRDAVANNDKDAFTKAAGINADELVAGKPYFDLVAEYMAPYLEKEKAKAAKKKKSEDMDVDETIRKVKGGYRLYFKDGKKNLGTYSTKGGAEKRERQVQYFKHAGESVEEGKFRERDIEEKLIPNEKLNDLKSRYLPDWEMLDHRILQAKYVAKDHRHAEDFVSYINKISEEMDHFAEVTQDVAEVAVKTTTFDVKGLTILDFKLALKVDTFAEKNEIEQVRMSGNFGMHESSYGRYWCSTDKKWKYRKGPKQKRSS